jgi:hypothetical protein
VAEKIGARSIFGILSGRGPAVFSLQRGEERGSAMYFNWGFYCCAQMNGSGKVFFYEYRGFYENTEHIFCK